MQELKQVDYLVKLEMIWDKMKEANRTQEQ